MLAGSNEFYTLGWAVHGKYQFKESHIECHKKVSYIRFVHNRLEPIQLVAYIGIRDAVLLEWF